MINTEKNNKIKNEESFLNDIKMILKNINSTSTRKSIIAFDFDKTFYKTNTDISKLENYINDYVIMELLLNPKKYNNLEQEENIKQYLDNMLLDCGLTINIEDIKNSFTTNKNDPQYREFVNFLAVYFTKKAGKNHRIYSLQSEFNFKVQDIFTAYQAISEHYQEYYGNIIENKNITNLIKKIKEENIEFFIYTDNSSENVAIGLMKLGIYQDFKDCKIVSLFKINKDNGQCEKISTKKLDTVISDAQSVFPEHKIIGIFDDSDPIIANFVENEVAGFLVNSESKECQIEYKPAIKKRDIDITIQENKNYEEVNELKSIPHTTISNDLQLKNYNYQTAVSVLPYLQTIIKDQNIFAINNIENSISKQRSISKDKKSMCNII